MEVDVEWIIIETRIITLKAKIKNGIRNKRSAKITWEKWRNFSTNWSWELKIDNPNEFLK